MIDEFASIVCSHDVQSPCALTYAIQFSRKLKKNEIETKRQSM